MRSGLGVSHHGGDVFDFAFQKGGTAGRPQGWKARRSCSAAPAGRRSPTRCSPPPARSSERQIRRGRQCLGPDGGAGPGRAALSGRAARPVARPGPRFRLPARQEFFQPSRPTAASTQKSDLATPPRRSSTTNTCAASPWATVRPHQPARGEPHRHGGIPGLNDAMTPAVVSESMMQWMRSPRRNGRSGSRCGAATRCRLAGLFDTIHSNRPDLQADQGGGHLCNDLIAGANEFDRGEGTRPTPTAISCPEESQAIDVEAIRAALQGAW